MFVSILVYAALASALAGAISILIPLRFLGIRSRHRGVAVATAGVGIAILAALLPVTERRADKRQSHLDDFMPRWQFDERHAIVVAAPPATVFEAIRKVSADEIRLFGLLTSIRRGGRKGPESIVNAPAQQPLLDVATRTTFVWLADEPPRELVVGTIVAAPQGFRRRGGKVTPELFGRPLQPDFALAAMNFIVAPDGRGGSLVSTETRVFANDRSSMRRFAAYWRLIRPGSDIIRRMWLRAIKRRAEGSSER
jgi:hypothetical protein